MPKSVALAAALGVVLGVAAGYVQSAYAARISTGTYSLPTGNPVVSGTTITSTWANATLSDIGTEITNSLDRNGRGAMLAALKLYAGTSSAPGLTFDSDTNLGLYRVAADTVALQCNAATSQKWEQYRTTITANVMATDGGTFTTNVTDGKGVESTGNGTGAGLYGTGGATSGSGASGVGGAPNGVGVGGQGTGSGAGVAGTGGATGPGGLFVGGATSGNGVTATGTVSGRGVLGTGAGALAGVRGVGGASDGNGIEGVGTGVGSGGSFSGGTTGAGGYGITATGGASTVSPGGYFSNGTAATGATPQDAIVLTNGYLKLDGVTAPNASTSIKNRLTPKNLIHIALNFSTDGAATFVSTDNYGFNATSARSGTDEITITHGQDFANTAYMFLSDCETADTNLKATTKATGTTKIKSYATASGGSAVVLDSGPAITCSVIMIGTQ